MSALTHLDAKGAANMVDVGERPKRYAKHGPRVS